MWHNRSSSLVNTSSSKPPLMPELSHPSESDESQQSSDSSTQQQEKMKKKKSSFPPRSASSSSSSRRKSKREIEADDILVASPEAPEHHQRPITAASTEEDLSFADFSSLDNFFTTGADSGLYELPPSGPSAYSKRYPDEEKKVEERSCVPNASGLFRRKKLSSVDVASVGNASDTMVSVSSETHITGRELHEKAKVSLTDSQECALATTVFLTLSIVSYRCTSTRVSTIGRCHSLKRSFRLRSDDSLRSTLPWARQCTMWVFAGSVWDSTLWPRTFFRKLSRFGGRPWGIITSK